MSVAVQAVLRTLARLSAAEQPQRLQLDLTRTAGLAWMGNNAAGWTVLMQDPKLPTTALWTPPGQMGAAVRRLASFDALHREDRLLRLGWAFVCGPAEVKGQRRRLCLPIVSRPLRLRDFGLQYALEPAGDAALWPLLTDWTVAADLESRLYAGESKDWVREALAASGFGDLRIIGAESDPQTFVGGDELVVVKGIGLLAGEPIVNTDHGSTLLAWSTRGGIEQTALAALYRPPGDTEPPVEDGGELAGALPLSPGQRAGVTAARTQPITVISGPPGSGKTHTLAALALDAVASGHSVLLTSRTRNAADVLGAALRRADGPTPVMFGDSELRQARAREFGDGLAARPPSSQLAAKEQAMRLAVAEVRRVEQAVGQALRDERLAGSARTRQALMPAHRAVAPLAFQGGADLARLAALLEDAQRPRRGPFSAWLAGRAARRARRAAGAAVDADLFDVHAALLAAEETDAQVRLAVSGGTSLAALRSLLVEQDVRGHAAVAAWLSALVERRTGPGPRRAVAALATALRAGRAARRRMLADIDTDDLLTALPLWVGPLSDVEDLLPAVPGMFDLVVIDEASHVDQPLAAPALLRGRRAVIAGDPRQLRHVSFVSDAAVREALADEGTQALADRLDVPRVSLLDAGAAIAEVHRLIEHHRCAPHLIGFAASRFYDGRLALLTTHPSIADADCIDVECIDGTRDRTGVNRAEVDAVLEHVRSRIAAGAKSIGVVSPFRAQADALEAALLERMSLQEITDGGLRVGTVHGVQGSEFDEVVISLAADGAAGWRFVNDQNLLAVLTTRARRHVHVVTSDPAPPGLAGQYLRHAGEAPRIADGPAPGDPWTCDLATELTRLGLATRSGYPLGQWRIDLVAGERPDAVAVETRPHPDGLAAHLARWRALAGAGWRVHDAYPSRFDHNAARAAVELARELGVTPSATSPGKE